MSLAFRAIGWILYFPTDMILASELTSTISNAVSSSIACDIDGGNTSDSDLSLFLKTVVEKGIEEYDRKSDGRVKKKLIQAWEYANENCGCENDITPGKPVKELLELNCSNWFVFARGISENIWGFRLRLNGIWQGYCKIQTKRISVDQPASLLHKSCVKIAREILENNKNGWNNAEEEWHPMDWKLYCRVYSMGLPEVLLKRLMIILDWIRWSARLPGMRFNSFGSFGQKQLWANLPDSVFETV